MTSPGADSDRMGYPQPTLTLSRLMAGVARGDKIGFERCDRGRQCLSIGQGDKNWRHTCRANTAYRNYRLCDCIDNISVRMLKQVTYLCRSVRAFGGLQRTACRPPFLPQLA
jgi:hypothetical protein